METVLQNEWRVAWADQGRAQGVAMGSVPIGPIHGLAEHT